MGAIVLAECQVMLKDVAHPFTNFFMQAAIATLKTVTFYTKSFSKRLQSAPGFSDTSHS